LVREISFFIRETSANSQGILTSDVFGNHDGALGGNQLGAGIKRVIDFKRPVVGLSLESCLVYFLSRLCQIL